MIVRILFKNGSAFKATVSKDVQLAKNFKLWELANNKGNAMLPQYEISNESMIFVDMLQEFRYWFGSISPTSGYRQEEFNRSVGGDACSAHLRGCAVDFKTTRTGAADRVEISDKWSEICSRFGVVGACNYYTHGYHLEAFSNRWYGSNKFAVRDYRGKKGDW